MYVYVRMHHNARKYIYEYMYVYACMCLNSCTCCDIYIHVRANAYTTCTYMLKYIQHWTVYICAYVYMYI